MEIQTEKQYRCKNCGRLLAKSEGEFVGGKLLIVCPRCKVYNTFEKEKKGG